MCICSRSFDVAVLSFLAAFMLNEYKVEEATNEELVVEGKTKTTGVKGIFCPKDVEQGLQVPEAWVAEEKQVSVVIGAQTTSSTSNGRQASQEPHHQPVDRTPHSEKPSLCSPSFSVSLFRSLYFLCIMLACLGFVFAVTGIVVYSWAVQPWEVSVVASTCFGACMLTIALSIIGTIYWL